MFGPKATAVILNILHPFKCPGLGVISNKWKLHWTTVHCLLAKTRKNGKLSNQAISGWILRHITSFSTNQNVLFLYSALKILLSIYINISERMAESVNLLIFVWKCQFIHLCGTFANVHSWKWHSKTTLFRTIWTLRICLLPTA